LYDFSYKTTHSGEPRHDFVRFFVQNNARRTRAPWFCTIFRTKQRTQDARALVLYDFSYKTAHVDRSHHGFVRFFVQNSARWPLAPWFCTIFCTKQRTQDARAMVLYDFSYKTTHAGRTHAWFTSRCRRTHAASDSSDHRRYTACRLRMIVRNSSSSSTGISLSRFHLYRQRSGGQSISRFVRIVARSRDR